jgi:hypothetical protein
MQLEYLIFKHHFVRKETYSRINTVPVNPINFIIFSFFFMVHPFVHAFAGLISSNLHGTQSDVLILFYDLFDTIVDLVKILEKMEEMALIENQLLYCPILYTK